jgi:aspartate racemase
MTTRHCIGLVGGLGVGAAVYYYEKLAKAHESLGRSMDLVMAHAEIPRVMEFIRAGDRPGLANYLNHYIQRMQAAGAEIAVVPAVTPHYCIHQLMAISPLPVLNIFDPLNRELAARGLKRIAVLGTRFVMESDLYGEVSGVAIVRPRPEEIEQIHNTYTKMALTGEALPEQHSQLTAIAQTLVRRDNVDAIVLAGTDLTLIFNESNTSFPYVDCAALHIQAIMQQLFAGDVATPQEL